MSESMSLRRMTSVEYLALPSVHAIPKRPTERNIAMDYTEPVTEWDITTGTYDDFGVDIPDNPDVEFSPQMRLLRLALDTIRDLRHPPEAPTIDITTGQFAQLPYIHPDRWQSDGGQQLLTDHLPYASADQKEVLSSVIQSLPEIIERRLQEETEAHVEYLNRAREYVLVKVQAGLWVTTTRLDELYFDREIQFHIGSLKGFSQVVSSAVPTEGLPVPRIEPIVDFVGEGVLLPGDTLLYGLSIGKID